MRSEVERKEKPNSASHDTKMRKIKKSKKISSSGKNTMITMSLQVNTKGDNNRTTKRQH